jgi:nicotinamidase-related amidase
MLLVVWLWGHDASTTSNTTKIRHVLMVIDMQKDYDWSANMDLYGDIKSPFCANISDIVPEINNLRRSRHWDKVVFTQDWLNASTFATSKPFCIADTAGADLLDSLEVTSDDFKFSKNKDDAFNLVQAIGDAPRGYGLRDEGLRLNANSNALVDILRFWGFSSKTTVLTIAGQMTDRCVLKSVLHARELGYRVHVVRSAVYTTASLPDSFWHFPLEPPSPLPVDLLTEVTSSRVGAGNATAFEYMQAAGMSIV